MQEGFREREHLLSLKGKSLLELFTRHLILFSFLTVCDYIAKQDYKARIIKKYVKKCNCCVKESL